MLKDTFGKLVSGDSIQVFGTQLSKSMTNLDLQNFAVVGSGNSVH